MSQEVESTAISRATPQHSAVRHARPYLFPNSIPPTVVAGSLVALDLGIYVVAFSYPVVPMGKARIRVQVCANHSTDDIDACVAAFVAAREQGAG